MCDKCDIYIFLIRFRIIYFKEKNSRISCLWMYILIQGQTKFFKVNLFKKFSTGSGTSEMFWIPKWYPSFNAFLELYFNKANSYHIILVISKLSLQHKRYSFFLDQSIYWICCLLNMCGISSARISLVTVIPLLIYLKYI